MENISINTEYIKLDQLLKLSGVVGSGAEAKMVIQNGNVLVNGNIEYQRGKKIRKGDIVKCHDMDIKIVDCG